MTIVICFYDTNLKFVSSAVAEAKKCVFVNAPFGARFCRICVKYSDRREISAKDADSMVQILTSNYEDYLEFNTGVVAPDGTIAPNGARIVTNLYPAHEFYLSVDSGFRYNVYSFGGDNGETLLGNTGFLTEGNILADVLQDSATHFRVVLAYEDNKTIGATTAEIYSVVPRLHFYTPNSKEYWENYKRPMSYNPTNYVSDVPENIGVLNTILNMKQMAEVKYTPLASLPQQSGNFVAGVQKKGLPYSSTRPEALFVPGNVSLHTFMTAIQNPNSYLY